LVGKVVLGKDFLRALWFYYQWRSNIIHKHSRIDYQRYINLEIDHLIC
jgi:hypothetical protein